MLVMLRRQETFVPLSHRPGHAQADFGEADGYIGGKKVRSPLILHVNVSLIVLRPARVKACFLAIRSVVNRRSLWTRRSYMLPPEERTFSYHKNFRGKSCGMSNFEQIATR